MSQAAVAPKRHRATRSAVMPPGAPSSQNPQNPHHLNSHAYAQNSQVETNRPLQPTTPPRTPRRVDQFQQASQNLSSSAATESASKQRSRNKNRPKNVMTSPAMTRNDRNTPPLTGANSAGMPTSAKPISTPSAYAGPTFHASPAPSALPIPSFYSKSVPDSPGTKGLQPRNGNSPTDPNSPSAPVTQPTSQLHREESPLDFIFKADREEKARARSASSTLKSHDAAGPFPPPPQSPSNIPTPSRASQERARNRNSSNGIFAMEMDGPSSPGTPFGPAFSTPYAERINAARASTTPARPQTDPSQPSQQSIDKAEALKAYLFSGRPLQSSVASNSYGGAGGAGGTVSSPRPNNLFSQEGNSARKSGRSSGLRQEVTPTRTPTKTPDRNNHYTASPTPPSRVFGHSNVPHYNDFMDKFNSHTNSPTTGSPPRVSSGGEGADLRGMEESLRKILKLEPTNNSGVIGSGIGNVPGASVSVPNYVGGRQPPMNGMHNGVMGS